MATKAKLTREHRLLLVIGISLSFFIAEISVGFYTRSLALVADAFHYLNDLVGFIVAYAAVKISARDESPKGLSFGWQRAQLLGAFFNGVFLLALGVSIFLQSIERFVSLQRVEKPKLILIIGCVGLALNILSATFLHEHDHDHGNGHTHDGEHMVEEDRENTRDDSFSTNVPMTPHHEHRHQATPRKPAGYDLGMLGVLLHVIGDAINNIPGIESVHELHVWALTQRKAIASAHVVVKEHSVSSFVNLANVINECFHAYGIHSTTLQPELAASNIPIESARHDNLRKRSNVTPSCQITCGNLCEDLTCCR
ncbi:hypothetical protein FE257_013043 [Aspergillus nanangensis]|uniref:Cation efflux protein transmembrane domain-containing protein n=1 Tax=Aspergillus nanangensis TaxID=2582783 RepID=A0AAD4GQB2_ASPNN|nr:hypothetical protein FE257_013043 [Aspergillus nanangensis]